ncbi:MAG: GtrA family protein [Thermomicrobiales bacterium]
MTALSRPALPQPPAPTTLEPRRAVLDRLLDRVPRPLRFGAVGGSCAAFQLLALALLVRRGVEPHGANALAFLLSTQANFVLSSIITWRDRRIATGWMAVGKRLAGYNALALGSLAINQLAFTLALPATDVLVASGLGILAGMVLTYVVSGQVLFRRVARQNGQRLHSQAR